ncbi:MAG: YqgE/AlgH family protein [Corticimicrobacter sp.]|uniref:YqgE/AlgH family protein n=1 Tax=Corticimicrobacter sp. TaxID=2678536 RepID=UPI0032DACAC8
MTDDSRDTRAEMVPEASAPAFAGFANQFLLAMPEQVGGSLAGSVIYVCEHSERGALGLVINRPTDLTLGALLERIDMALEIHVPQQDAPVFFGGPVQTDRGFVLHMPTGDFSSSLHLGELMLTTSRDILQATASGLGPERMLVTLGYAGWGAGQLETEMAQNAWLNVQADIRIIFDVPPEDRYEAALALLGIDPGALTGAAGHA